MSLSHNPWLVLLSLLVAIQGAYVGLSLARELARRPDHRRLLLAGAAVSLATAIWSMHFIGMLAAQLPPPINFLVLPTLLSAVVAILFVGLSVFLASNYPDSQRMLVAAAAIMGSGIVAMHFTGMAALHTKATIHHDPLYIVLSWIVGVSASGLAISYAFADRRRTPLIFASVALGLAISGMHYTAMAGMTLQSVPVTQEIAEMALSPDALAVIVALVAFCLSSVFLLILVPDHPLVGSAGDLKSAILAPSPEPLAVAGAGGQQIFREARMAEVAASESAGLPVASAGSRPTSVAKQVQDALTGAVLPVRQHGSVRNLPASQVYAVKADAHYTWVFDGHDSHFCSLSIAEVETRLDSTHFARVHRSHLVAIGRIARLKKSGDGGIVELNSAIPYSLPVSRRQVSVVKSVLNARA